MYILQLWIKLKLINYILTATLGYLSTVICEFAILNISLMHNYFSFVCNVNTINKHNKNKLHLSKYIGLKNRASLTTFY